MIDPYKYNTSNVKVSNLIQPMTKEAAAANAEAIMEIYRKTKLGAWKDWELSNVMMDLPRKWEFSFLLLNNKSLVGFLIASVYKVTYVHCHQLSVIPEFRGHGGATSLMKSVIELSKKQEMHTITLETPPDTEAVQRIHASLGFQIISDVITLNEYLADKGKPQKNRGYYPINKDGEKVWYMHLKGV